MNNYKLIFFFFSVHFSPRLLCFVYFLLRPPLRDISSCLCFVTVLKDSPMWPLPPLHGARATSRPMWSFYCSAVSVTSGWPNVSYLTLSCSHPLIYAPFIFNCLVGGRAFCTLWTYDIISLPNVAYKLIVMLQVFLGILNGTEYFLRSYPVFI
jgi:hypothetical protein